MPITATPNSSDPDSVYQRREWQVQRAGWMVLSAALVAGAAGAYGHGPLARARVGQEGGVRIEYERFVRSHVPTRFAVTLPGGEDGDTVSLWIDRDLADRASIREIEPEPLTVADAPGRLVYRFLVAGDSPARVVFELEPDRIGRFTGRVGLPGSQELTFSLLVYP